MSRSFGYLYLHFCLEIVKSLPLRFGRCQFFLKSVSDDEGPQADRVMDYERSSESDGE